LPGDLKLEGDFTARDFFKHIRKLRGSKQAWKDILNLKEWFDQSPG
jgi:hypothetical protein